MIFQGSTEMMQVLVAANIFRNSKKSEDIVRNIGKVSIKQESGEESGARPLSVITREASGTEDASWHPVRAGTYQ